MLPTAVPPITTSHPFKSLTDSLKTAVKVMGAVLVGSAYPAAWLIVTVGGVGSNVTVLSVLVEAVFPLPAASVAPPAGIVAITVPPRSEERRVGEEGSGPSSTSTVVGAP